MYENLTYTELNTIVESAHGPCVSIYMPTNLNLPEMQDKDIIRLRNLLDEAETAVRAAAPDLRTPDIEALLDPAKRLLNEERLLWKQEGAGMAIFLAPNFSRVLQLPLRAEPLVVVGRQFHVTPLLPLLTENGHFYLLALSQKAVRLFQCDRFSVRERTLSDTPHSLAEMPEWDDIERTSQRHRGNSSAAIGGRVAMLHGSGISNKEMHKEELQRFLHQLAIGVKKTLQSQKAPLVLAGVDYVVSMYRQLNQYPHLVDNLLPGNPDELSAQELHKRAWALMRPLLDRKRAEAVDRYQQLASTEQASDTLRPVLTAAQEGRVDTLFTAVGQQQWGHYDLDTGYIHLHDDAKVGGDDLFNLAAIETMKNGGVLYPMAPDQVPGASGIAAIYRY